MVDRRVVLHCNCGPEYGMGHLMRTIAIAADARQRGWEIDLVGDLDDAGIAIARRMLGEVEVVALRGSPLAAELSARAQRAAVIHLDSYWPVPDLSRTGALISNMQDGPYGVRSADLAIDANLGAERWFAQPDRSGVRLAGIDLAVIRRQVLDQRGSASRGGTRPRVLLVMGGTDPLGLSARVIRGLGEISAPLDLTVIDPRERPDVLSAAATSPHLVDVHGFVEDLPALARHHDLVITAAGTSVWDFACMGLPMALVCAVDNQRAGYREVIGRKLAIGLGEPPHPDLEARIGSLSAVLGADADLASQAQSLMRAVDGLGTWRIVSAWDQLIRVPLSQRETTAELTARLASLDDASLLFEWRNDPQTRSNSRSRGALVWSDHRSWMERSLADPDRRLLIVESEGVPVATCRWDRLTSMDWEVSITMAPAARGRGLALSVLEAATEALDADAPVRMMAVVHTDNLASQRLFERAGYLPHLPPDDQGFRTLAKWRLLGA